MPYWIQETLIATPAFLWVYVLLGVPYALILLPRDDWQNRPLVVMTGFAMGSGLLTVLMFVLGSLNRPLLTRGNVVAGLLVLTVMGVVGAVGKSRGTVRPANMDNGRVPFTSVEKLLIGLLVVAVVIRWVIVAYWSFTAYDALWVYGYEGRLYFLEALIPAKIDYYPQFLPLQYTFGQLIYGDISDSAARAVLPLLHIGSILAAYNLGSSNFNRRVGIVLAALWGLYPAVGEWSRMGDLEVPLAFLITGSATFFFMAWNGERWRYRYALIAGIIYGIALWTKPTAGAFALGIILINVIELVRSRFSWCVYRPRFEVSAIMGLACAPLGGAWYIRNLVLGHVAVEFPPPYWHTIAERGGGQLLWLLAAIVVIAAFVHITQTVKPPPRATITGLILLIFGIVPSATARFFEVPADSPILLLYPSLEGLPRLGWFEWVMIVAGISVLVRAFLPYARSTLNDEQRDIVIRVGWVLAAIVPYYIVYFWQYSYHYRLAFAIVPMMALPTAVVLANWFTDQSGGKKWALIGGILLLALPGLISPIYDVNVGWDYLWSNELPDDHAKIASGNEALMWMVDGFEIYEDDNGRPPSVIAPAIQRLPFFFPTADIDIESVPTRLSELDGVTYFVDSHPAGTGAYEHIPILENQVLSALGRTDIMRKAWWKDDGFFRYDIYELYLDNRFVKPNPVAAVEDEIIFGDFARFTGHEISSDVFQIGQRRTVKLFWEVIGEPDADYMTYIHLRDADDTLWMPWDGPVGLTEQGRYYTTLVWEPGEYVVDERLLRLTELETPSGEDFTIVIGMYNLATGDRVGITRNGEPIGDGYRLDESITVIPAEEE